MKVGGQESGRTGKWTMIIKIKFKDLARIWRAVSSLNNFKCKLDDLFQKVDCSQDDSFRTCSRT